MDKSIYRYILRHTRRDQLWIILLTAASMPLVYYSLEIPKLIINKAIGGGAVVYEVFGMAFSQIQYLLLLSGVFLAMVIVNGGMKYIINVYRGVLGERMLRRFRYTLYARILRFPLPEFKNISSGEIIPMVTAETEPLGGFIGDSIALPVMQGGLLLTYLSFIFVQDFWLGVAAVALYPPQIYLIPRLQHKVNLLSKQRVQEVRQLAERIGETVDGIVDVHANDAGHWARADISRRLGGIFGIRFEIYRRKFFIKFLNNFLAQLTPFFFYSIGGYLVLQNQLSLGALVAVLAAYKDISPPWKELLKFYQITEDIKVKYAQIIERFAPAGMFDEGLLAAPKTEGEGERLQGGMRAVRLSYVEDGVAQVDGVDFELEGDCHTAILSKDGSAGDELTQLLARLLVPSGGGVSVGEADLAVLPEAVTGARIGYCSAASRLFNASLRDNLYYGLKHQPQGVEGGGDAGQEQRALTESLASGNSTQDATADWVDIGLAGAADQGAFAGRVYDIIKCVELDDELLTLALRSTEAIDIPAQLAEQIVTLREQLGGQINRIEDGVIEPLDASRYSHNLTVEENLLFGAPKGGGSAAAFLETNPLVQDILRASGLQRELSGIGLQLAGLMVELFSDVPEDSALFDQYSFIKAADLPEYAQLLSVAGDAGVEGLDTAQRAKLASVSFKLCPARHRLNLVTPPIQEQVLAARQALMAQLGADNPHLQFFESGRYNYGIPMQENLLFGKIAYAKGHLQPQVTETIRHTLKAADLTGPVVMAGLSCPAGVGGANLSPVVRQKLVLARALLKNPDLLILNDALAGLDAKRFTRILKRVLKLRQGHNLICTLKDPSLLTHFDHALILDKNKLIHNDTPVALSNVIETL